MAEKKPADRCCAVIAARPDKSRRVKSFFPTNLAFHSHNEIETVADDYFFVRADRKILKLLFKDILFVGGLKDYVVLQTDGQKIMTNMNIKMIPKQLTVPIFVRISKSYIINVQHITSFDNNSVFIHKNEIPIGNVYRNYLFDEFMTKKLLERGEF